MRVQSHVAMEGIAPAYGRRARWCDAPKIADGGFILEGVRDGALDASFFFGAIDAEDLRGEALRPLVYRIALPREWGMGERDTDWNAIAARPWILAPPTSSHRQLAIQLFQARGVSPVQVIEADNESVILNLVESGVGASIAREELALASEQEQRIAIWPGAELMAQLWFIFAAQREADPLLMAMRAVLHDVWRHEEPAAA